MARLLPSSAALLNNPVPRSVMESYFIQRDRYTVKHTDSTTGGNRFQISMGTDFRRQKLFLSPEICSWMIITLGVAGGEVAHGEIAPVLGRAP